jgi:16S rRNA G527 N7-methylase RsmG
MTHEIEELTKRVENLESFKSEIKKDFEIIMHEVKQGRQDSKNATIAVSEVTDKLNEILPYILPNSNVGNIGLFPRLKIIEERVDLLENSIKIFKAQLAIVAVIFGGLGSLLWSVIMLIFKLL